jgi:hypothetical protein
MASIWQIASGNGKANRRKYGVFTILCRDETAAPENMNG